MPLLEIVQTHQVSATIRLDQTTAEQIDQYAAFLHVPADDVVDKALAYVFAKDRTLCAEPSCPSPISEWRWCRASAASCQACERGGCRQ
jgi:hypothetical protein